MISAKAHHDITPVVSRERPATCHNVSGFAIAVSFLARSYSILCLQKITTIQIDNSARKRERQSNTQGNLAIAVFFATESAHLVVAVVVRFHIKILPHHLIHNSHRQLCRRLRRIGS